MTEQCKRNIAVAASLDNTAPGLEFRAYDEAGHNCAYM